MRKLIILIALLLVVGGCATPSQEITITQYERISETKTETKESNTDDKDSEKTDEGWQATKQLKVEQEAKGKTNIKWDSIDIDLDTQGEGFHPFKDMFQNANPKVIKQ
jgi:hypothetical protein